MNDNNKAAMTASAEKIERLERHTAYLESELAKARAASVDGLLGPLRLRQMALVYFGTEPFASVEYELAREFGPDVANGITRHLFDLQRAPLQAQQREAVQAAFAHGDSKW
jgi:hypothetical protein